METKSLQNLLKSLILALILLQVMIPSCKAIKNSTSKNPSSYGGKGKWQLLLNNTGVVAMHAALTHLNTVILFDRYQFGHSEGYRLRRRANGTRCSNRFEDLADQACYDHSVEYNILRNDIRPLNLEADTWSSSGSMLSNGTLLQTGGYGDWSTGIRYFEPCYDGHCEWKQSRSHLSDGRWYASNLHLPENDTVIVVGGLDAHSFEFVPKLSPQDQSYDLPFLLDTYESNKGGNNLYPILHLSSDGNLFIFANRDSILLDYKRNRVVKKYPPIPGYASRSYPSSGSSVILPLDHHDGFHKVEVMICGGASPGALAAAEKGKFLNGLKTCGRMTITGNKHKWKMEKMPGPRIMSDMIILPTGNILIINGVRRGCAGWNRAAAPSLSPYLYKPKKVLGKRFSILKSTKIARMYQSSAVLLPDGRVLVAGSNPNDVYTFKNVPYPTELRLQAFVPSHMDRKFDRWRPRNVSIIHQNPVLGEFVGYGEEFSVKFHLGRKPKELVFSAYGTPFTTHSISMNQRMLRLKCKEVKHGGDGWWSARLEAPPSANVAPAGYYLLTVVNGGIPSISHWIRFLNNPN